MSEIFNINWSLVGTIVVAFLVCGVIREIYSLITDLVRDS